MISALLATFISLSFARAPKASVTSQNAKPPTEQGVIFEDPDSAGTLAKYFKENNCPAILKYFEGKTLTDLLPFELALAAYCEPPGKDPEKMFAFAEDKSPSDDVILLLHGRYRWKKFKLDSSEVWEKLANQARDPHLQKIAEQYLQGNGEDKESAGESTENRSGYFELGAISENNPSQLSISDPGLSKGGSTGWIWNLASLRRSDFEFGYVDWSTSASGTQYDTASDSNLMLLDFEPMIALQNTPEQYFLLRPLVSVFGVDGRLAYGSAGLSCGELWQYPSWDLRFLFTMLEDRYYQAGAENQGGTHYLLEQKIAFKWERSLISLNLFWDKQNARQDEPSPKEITPYTNNSGGARIGYQVSYQKFSAGLTATVAIRQDESDTLFLNNSQPLVRKKRRDTSYNAEPWVSWQFAEKLSALVYYSYNRITSNMNQDDAVDRNINDAVTGFLIKTNF